ncbi:MAG: type II toxin-antitoxin system RelE/ParE family toxin [Kiritimatiellae bacterium]|nr:type II toxin-antitoxin system RelE/ParE family toxin [Kiritimatiellia bacterium]
MAQYKVIVRKSVSKDLKQIPKKDVQRILRAIRALSQDPRPPQSKILSGEEKYRLRCGVYRVLYEIRDAQLVVCVVRARHRKDVYR